MLKLHGRIERLSADADYRGSPTVNEVPLADSASRLVTRAHLTVGPAWRLGLAGRLFIAAPTLE